MTKAKPKYGFSAPAPESAPGHGEPLALAPSATNDVLAQVKQNRDRDDRKRDFTNGLGDFWFVLATP